MNQESLAAFSRRLNERIEEKYLELGHQLGWRLLYSPLGVMDGARVAFIGLNPGGGTDDPDHGRMTPRTGSAYVTELWKGREAGEEKLQRRAQDVFSLVGVEPESVLAGNIVLFRHPNWKDTPQLRQAKAFGLEIWQEILRRASPRLNVCIGVEAFDLVRHLVSAGEPLSCPASHGTWLVRRALFDGGIVAGLPHLSRYDFAGHPARTAAVRWAMGLDPI